MLIRMLWPFLIDLCVLLRWKSFMYILDTNPLSDMCFANILPHSVGYFFTLLIVPFEIQILKILTKVNLFIFFFYCRTFRVHPLFLRCGSD